MDIHQIQVKYDPVADRLLLQVRSRAGEVCAVWLTRRMCARLWPSFQQVVTQQGMERTAPGATVLPEAQAMLQQVARERPLPNADFSTQFDPTPQVQPLGPEPLLPAEIQMTPAGTGGMTLSLREHRARSLELRLSADLSSALLRLVDQALASADWAIGPLPAPESSAPPGPLS